MRRFHETFYAPASMVVSVVGAVKAERAHNLIAAYFGDWSAVRPVRDVNLDAPRVVGRHYRHIAMPGKRQTNLMLGLPGPSQLDPNWLTYVLINSILGQFGIYGRLGERVRKGAGLVYYIGSCFEGRLGPGPWHVYAGVDPGAVDLVTKIVLSEMRRVRERKVKPAELDDNKAYFVGVMPLQIEANEGIAGQILNMVRYRRGLDWLLAYSDRVNAITAADIQTAAQQWLDPDSFVLTTAGPPYVDADER